MEKMSASYWRINPIAMISAATVLISLFLPWWGVDQSFGVGIRHWTLWSPPGAGIIRDLGIGHPIMMSAASTAQSFGYASLVVLVLALIVASLALAGSLTMHRTYLVVGLVLAVLTPIVYIVSISYITSHYCFVMGPTSCASVMGSTSFAGNVATWGFDTGFYAFIAAALVLAVGLSMNNSLARTVAIRSTQVIVPTGQPAKQDP